MGRNIWMWAVAVLATTLMVGVASAADSQKKSKHGEGPAHNGATKNVRMETITLVLYGAETPESAKALGDALASHNVSAPVEASPSAPVRTTASIDRTTDLGSVGQAVSSASTANNKSATRPSLDLVVFGKFDKDTAKKFGDALAKVKGVDATNSKVDATNGEATVRIVGGSKVTADQIHRALNQAGIAAQLTKPTIARTS